MIGDGHRGVGDCDDCRVSKKRRVVQLEAVERDFQGVRNVLTATSFIYTTVHCDPGMKRDFSNGIDVARVFDRLACRY